MAGFELAWEVAVFALYVGGTTCAALWKRGGGAGGAEGAGGTKHAYVFAGGGVSMLSMILSVSRGTLGVRSFLGFPSELVYFGSAMWETLYGLVLAFPLVAWLFVPLFLSLHTTSVYEYLELRFKSVWVRRLTAGVFVVRQTLNLAVTVWTPCVALHAVLHLPHWAAAAVLAAAAAVATVLGGLAAAIRADVIQTVTMVAVSAAIIVVATLRAGGVAQVLQDNVDGGRLNFFNFTWDLRTRVDTLSALVGQLFMSLSVYGCQQTFVQRYCALGSARRVRRMLLANVPAVALLFSLSWVVGMALFALYRRCDPLAAGQIGAPDEVLPHFVQTQLSAAPGALGLFLGCLFNGALSFVVSNVNSLATVTWEDFVSAAPPFRGVSDRQQLIVIKTIAVLYCAAIGALSQGVGAVGGVVEGSLMLTSATSGALLGVFALAAAAPRCTAAGALAGAGAALALPGWLAVGRLLYVRTRRDMLPLNTQGCDNSTLLALAPRAVNRSLLAPPLAAAAAADAASPEDSVVSGVLQLYAVSYMWYAVLGTLVCVAVGCAVSECTRDPRHRVDPRLLHPLLRRFVAAEPDAARGTGDDALDDVKLPPTPPPAHPAPATPAPAADGNRHYDAYDSPAPPAYAPHPAQPPSPPARQRTRF